MFFIEDMARGGEVWDYVNPELEPQPEEPVMPTPVTLSSVNPNASSVNDLTESEFVRYRFLRQEYRAELEQYQKKRSALNTLSTQLIASVSRNNIPYIRDCKTTWAKLRELQKRLAPTDRARKIETLRQYQALQKPPKMQSIDKWLKDWEQMYTEAKKLNLAEVQDERPLFDFLNALKSVDSVYANTRNIEISDAVDSNRELPTLYDVIEKYRNYRRVNQALSTSKASHSAFATFQDEQPSTEPSERPKSMRCLCGEDHRFEKCPYLIDFLRSPDWKPDPEIQKRIKEKLQDRPRLKFAVNIARRRAKKKRDDKDNDKSKDNDESKDKDKTDVVPIGSFATAFARAGSTNMSYKLQDCWTLDGAADIHVCNDPTNPDFEITRKASEDDMLFGGRNTYRIEAYGTAYITVDTPDGPGRVALLETALVPGYLTNCVALSRFAEKNVHWDSGRGVLYHLDTGKTFCYVKPLDGLWILQKRSSKAQSAFPTMSRRPRPEKEASSAQWHAIMGHAGKEAIEHLPDATEGVKISGNAPAPVTVDSEVCSVSKAHRLISRRMQHKQPSTRPSY